MVISDSTISSDVWTAIRTKIVAAAPYVTAVTGLADTVSASINAVYNDKDAARPQIVINPALVDEDNWKFGSLQGDKIINVVIECWGRKTSHIDDLWDQTRVALAANDIDGLDLIAISSDYGFSNPGDQKMHVKSGTFTYERE